MDELADFRACCSRARRIDQPPPGADAEPDYQGAGAAMVAESDLLIAVWDGNRPRGRGGTGDVAARAGAGKDRRIPVLWIDPSADEPHPSLAQWPEQSMWDDSFVEPTSVPLPERLPGRLALAWPFGSRRAGPAAQLGSFRQELMEQRAFNHQKTTTGDEPRPCGSEEACREPDPGPPQEVRRRHGVLPTVLRPRRPARDRIRTPILVVYRAALPACRGCADLGRRPSGVLPGVVVGGCRSGGGVPVSSARAARCGAHPAPAQPVVGLSMAGRAGSHAVLPRSARTSGAPATAIEAKYEEGSQRPWFKRAFDDIAEKMPHGR